MNQWISEIVGIVRVTVGNPSSPVELGVLSALGLGGLIIGLYKIGDLLGAHQATKIRAVLVAIVTLGVTLLAVAAVNLYIVPKIVNPNVVKYLPIGVAVLLMLVVAAPMMMLLQKTSYLSGLFSVLLSAALAAVLIGLGSGAFRAIGSGGKDLEKQKVRKDAINKMME